MFPCAVTSGGLAPDNRMGSRPVRRATLDHHLAELGRQDVATANSGAPGAIAPGFMLLVLVRRVTGHGGKQSGLRGAAWA